MVFIFSFTCDEGYRLVGYEVRRCREDGLWSWGVEAECIMNRTYYGTMSAIFIGILFPIAILLLFVFICWKRGTSKSDEKDTKDEINRIIRQFYFRPNPDYDIKHIASLPVKSQPTIRKLTTSSQSRSLSSATSDGGMSEKSSAISKLDTKFSVDSTEAEVGDYSTIRSATVV